MTNLYMETPTLVGIRMPGIYSSGSLIPQDEHNEHWQAYLEFVKGGGAPLPFDPTLRWDGNAYVSDAQLVKQNLVDLRQQALQRVEQFHAETVQRLVGNPTQVEKDTWSLKQEIANAIMSDQVINVAGEQFLAAAGIDTKGARQTWAKSVLANATSFAKVAGLAERLREDTRAAVRAAKDGIAIEAILEAQRQAAAKAVASLKR